MNAYFNDILFFVAENGVCCMSAVSDIKRLTFNTPFKILQAPASTPSQIYYLHIFHPIVHNNSSSQRYDTVSCSIR